MFGLIASALILAASIIPQTPARGVVVSSFSSPTDIAGLQLWLDASDASTLWEDSGGTTPAADDGDTIGRWSDKSGNGYNATQGTGANEPTLKVAIQNGKNILRFDGSNDGFTLASGLGMANNVSGFTIFAVAKTDTTANARKSMFFATRNGSTSQGRATLNKDDTTGTRLETSGRRLDADSSAEASGGTLGTTDFFQAAAVFDYTNTDLYLYHDGTQVASNTSFQTSGNTSATDSSGIGVGQSPDGGFFWDGDISEIIVYNSALSAGNRQLVEGYLRTKWGLP